MKLILFVTGLFLLFTVLFLTWLFWIEPYFIKKRLLNSKAAENQTVAQILEHTKIAIGGDRWECSASDVAISCRIHIGDKTVEYLWGIDEDGFYPGNGRTLRLFPEMARGIDLTKFTDDEIISGHLFKGKNKKEYKGW